MLKNNLTIIEMQDLQLVKISDHSHIFELRKQSTQQGNTYKY